MEAPRLPSNEADLAEWAVYADYLMTRGEPRGELIAHDLALSATPERTEVDELHKRAAPLCKAPRSTPVTWCLGHARSIDLPGKRGTFHRFDPTGDGTLSNAIELLSEPRLTRLEAIAICYQPRPHQPRWRRLFRALPASCRRVDVTPLGQWTDDAVDELVGLLPPTVRVLGIANERHSIESYVARFVTDRFDLVDLTSARLAPDALDAVFAGLRLARTVELCGAATLSFDRYRFGLATDAGVRAAGRMVRVPEWTIAKLQNRFGIIGVRAQLERSLPEGHLLEAENGRLSTHTRWGGAHLVRRAMKWTLRPDAGTQLWIGDRELADTEELRHGDAFAIRQHPSMGEPGSERIDCVFVARDLDAMLRSMHAGWPR